MKVLELFSGTGSVKKVCDTLGWECISVDISNQYHEVDYKVDILEWDYKELAKDFNIIWASPPCATFSNLNCTNYGKRLKSINNEELVPSIKNAIIKKLSTSTRVHIDIKNISVNHRKNENNEIVIEVKCLTYRQPHKFRKIS